jgi:hypothetical protein
MMKWQLDRRIPIALLATLIMQFAAALIWASRLNARVETLEIHAEHSHDLSEKLARIDERVQAMKQDTDFIKQSINRITK